MAKARDLKDLQANLAEIPAADIAEEIERPEDSRGVLDTHSAFQEAIDQAPFDGTEYLEVSERLFKSLTKGRQTRYLTYGKPGVKVYQVGTREREEAIDTMSAEAYGNKVGRKVSENVGF